MVLLLLLIVTAIAFGFINPSIFTLAGFFALTRASIIPAIYCLSLMLVMVQGGIDMSFAAIGSFAGYCAIFIFTQRQVMDISMLVVILISIGIAVFLELINWFLIAIMNLQPFIITLAMQTLLKGGMLAFVSTSYIYSHPTEIAAFATNYLARASFSEGTEAVLHISVVIVIVMYLLIHLLLEHTTVGRSIYAIGDDVDAAQRAGIKVVQVRFIVFVLAGVICGIAGVLHDSLSRSSMPMPADVVGQELFNIAAVVLGIGTTKKAWGSVPGTLLGVLYLRFISTNLIMLGIPSYWQRGVSGLIIFIGFLVQMSKRQVRSLQ
jgi:simple sugar transport system permease protein